MSEKRARGAARKGSGRAVRKPLGKEELRSRGAGWREVAPASEAREEAKAPARKSSRPRKARDKRVRPDKQKDRKEKNSRLRAKLLSPRVVIIVVVLAACSAFVFSPLMRDLDSASKRRKVEAKLKEEKAKTSKLQQEMKGASSKQYVEQEARKQRLVSPGETLYLVTTEGGAQVKYRVKNLQSMDEAWARIRLMMNCKPSKTGP